MENLIDVETVLRPIWRAQTRFEVSEIEAVTTIDSKPTFIHPKLRPIKLSDKGRIIVISAPGAVGKTTFAKYSTHDKRGYYWDLAKLRLGDNTFIGTLASKFGSKSLTKVLEEFNNGTLPFFFDAFDEAEIISGWEGVENFVEQICNYSANSKRPNVVFFSRAETAGILQLFLEDRVGEDGYSMFEIEYFDEIGAIRFVEEYLKNNEDTSFQQHPEPFNRALRSIFAAVSHGMNVHDEDYWQISDVRSFIGYSPVLQTIGSFLLKQNFNEVVAQFENKTSALGGVKVIIDFIQRLLERDQKKFIEGLKKRVTASAIPSGWDDWFEFFMPIDQINSAIIYVSDNGRCDNIDFSGIPEWLRKDYIQSVKDFLPNHPFLKGAKGFSSPAFRDYSLSTLLIDSGHEKYAKIFIEKGNFALTPLFAYFYVEFNHNKCIGPHVGLIYEAASSKRTIDSSNLLTFVKHIESHRHLFELVNLDESSSLNFKLDCLIDDDKPLQFERRLQNATIDIQGHLTLGRSTGSIELSDVEIRAEKITLRARECIFNCHNGNNVTIQARVFFQEDYAMNLRKIGEGSLEINWPDGHAYPWTTYFVDGLDQSLSGFEQEIYALKRIFEPFRKHKREDFAKQSEFIDNMIVSGNQLRKDILDYLLELKIMYRKSGEKKYFVNEEILISNGINWQALKSLSVESNQSLVAFVRRFRAHKT